MSYRETYNTFRSLGADHLDAERFAQDAENLSALGFVTRAVTHDTADGAVIFVQVNAPQLDGRVIFQGPAREAGMFVAGVDTGLALALRGTLGVTV